MKPNPDIAALTAQFEQIARAFTPVNKSRYAKLQPFRESIAELRGKGASYALIRELLATTGLTVALDTIGAFVREVIEARPPVRSSARHPRPHPQRTHVGAVHGTRNAAHNAPTELPPKTPLNVAPSAEDNTPTSAADASLKPRQPRRPTDAEQ